MKMQSNSDSISMTEDFQFCLECPKLFLADHFSELRSQIDYEAIKALNNETNLHNSITKEQITKKWTDFITKINEFEAECSKNCSQNLMKFNDLISSENTPHLKELSTKEKFVLLKRMLFMDKNLIFIKSIKIHNEKVRSDPSAFGKLIFVNKYYH